MTRVEVKTNKFDYTMTFENGMMSMTCTDNSLNFENYKIADEDEAIERFKMLLKMRGEEIIDWYEWSETDLEYDALFLAKDEDMRVRAEFYEGFDTMESEIMIALLNAKVFDAKCVAEGLNRMYWDTIIWENDDVAVKYTSPCEDFEKGCLLVVEKESECLLGSGIEVSSNQDAVEHVVQVIFRYFGEIKIVTK